MNEKAIRILVAEGVPSLNKGELAILIGMLKTFDILGKVDVSVFSYYPSIDKKRYPESIKIIDVAGDLFLGNSLTESKDSVRARAYLFAALQHFFFSFLYKIQGKNALKFLSKPIWRAYYESDVIIICHDGVDFVGGWILNFSPLYITMLAKTIGKPIVIYANGGTKFRRKIWKVLAKFILNYVSLITIRDEDSFSYLKNLPFNNGRVYLTGDPAILLPPVDYERVQKIMLEEDIRSNEGLLIGAIISHQTLLKGSNGDTKSYNTLLTEIARLFDRLIERYQATIVFVPHCIDPIQNKDDRPVSKKIYESMKHKNNVRVIVKEYSPEELKGLMGQLSLLISTRVHASIGALSMSVPTCTITYSSDKRAIGLIGKMLEQEKWIYDIGYFNRNDFFNLITELIMESSKIRRDLPSIVTSAKQKALLNGKLLKTFLGS